ncbi:MAG: cysteine desulfurase family protein [Synergistaceae bacterium]
MDYIYANNAATTKIKPETLEEMLPYFLVEYGNPSSIDRLGKRAKSAVEKSRKYISGRIGCKPTELIFTSGGSESNNMAIKGATSYENQEEANIITTSIEHHSVTQSVINCKFNGDSVTMLPVDAFGLINMSQLKDSIQPNTSLVTISVCNNEIGTIQDIKAIYKIICDYGKNRPLFHVDAVQGMAHLPYNSFVGKCDMFSFSGHKFGAPKGVGGLYISEKVNIDPLIYGGRQEFSMRAGTENVAGIVGMAAAMKNHSEGDNQRVGILTDHLYEGLIDIEGCQLNSFYKSRRVPGIVNASFSCVGAESLLIALEQKGVIVSAGSACTSDSNESSHVLRGIGLTEEYINGTIRISLGDYNTKKEVDFIIETIAEVVPYLRQQKWRDE